MILRRGAGSSMYLQQYCAQPLAAEIFSVLQEKGLDGSSWDLLFNKGMIIHS
jgi:hypothetical protein